MKLPWIIEAVDEPKDGEIPSRWRVQLIRQGTSKNRNRYSLPVLHQAASLFEGVRALARSDEEHGKNTGKRVKDLVGWFTNPKPNEHGVEAIFEVEAGWLREKIHNAWKRGKKDYVGFSIVALAEQALAREGAGLVRDIRALKQVDFVDVIVNPSAGGEVLGLAEAEGGVQVKVLERLLKIVEAKRPEEYKKLTANPENIDEDAVVALVEAIAADEEKAERETKVTTEAATVDPKALQKLIAESVSPMVKDIRDGMLEDLAREKAARMAAQLISEAKLPEEAKARVLKMLPEKPTREQVTEAIDAERVYLAKHTSWTGPGSTRAGRKSNFVIESILDERDKWDMAMEGFFLGEDVEREIGGKKVKQPRYASVKEAYVDFTGDYDLTGGMIARSRVSEATIETSTWLGALGDHLRKAMQREYRMAPYDQWRNIADVVPLQDFRSNYRPQLGGFSNLASVAEGDAYAAFGTEPDDFTPSYAVTKYGATQVVNFETIVNDDVGAVRRMPRKMGRAAARTLNTNVWSPILNNSNVSWESVALFAAGHGGNITTSALSQSTIIAGRTVMQKQTEPQSGERLHIQPKWLAVPVDLEQTAYELTGSPGKPIINGAATTSRENEDIPNFMKSWGLTPLVIPHATDVDAWFLIADKSDISLLEVGFLQGRQEPELFVQDMPNVGSMFTNDQATYKVRHIYGVVVLDYRGMYGGIPA